MAAQVEFNRGTIWQIIALALTLMVLAFPIGFFITLGSVLLLGYENIWRHNDVALPKWTVLFAFFAFRVWRVSQGRPVLPRWAWISLITVTVLLFLLALFGGAFAYGILVGDV
ncbi:MAG: hypothetical protein OXC60_15575 [Litoreibacter sp.]|nr:hypothetical protein [Litoreibacter sp.]